jgi:hypothetical protein
MSHPAAALTVVPLALGARPIISLATHIRLPPDTMKTDPDSGFGRSRANLTVASVTGVCTGASVAAALGSGGGAEPAGCGGGTTSDGRSLTWGVDAQPDRITSVARIDAPARRRFI